MIKASADRQWWIDNVGKCVVFENGGGNVWFIERYDPEFKKLRLTRCSKDGIKTKNTYDSSTYDIDPTWRAIECFDPNDVLVP